MVESSLAELGVVLFEVGAILLVSQFIAFVFNKFGIPAALGLLMGGIFIGIITDIRGYTFSSDFNSIWIILTEIAVGFIAYDIGNEIDYHYWKTRWKGYGLVITSSIFTFVIVTVSLWLIFSIEFWFAMLFGAIAMTTAPAVTSDILGDYHSEGILAQSILFLLAIDAVLSIISVNFSLLILQHAELDFISMMINTLLSISQLIIVSVIISVIAMLFLYILLKRKIFDEKSMVEWIFGICLLIIGFSILLGGSIILSMFLFGFFLKSFEQEFDKLEENVLQIETVVIPIVLLFYVLMGLIIDLSVFNPNSEHFKLYPYASLILFGFFFIRLVSKVTAIYMSGKFSRFNTEIRSNLPLCSVSQAGLALGLAGLGYNQLDNLGYSEQGTLLITIVGISVILSQIIGPLLFRIATKNVASETTKFNLLSAMEESG